MLNKSFLREIKLTLNIALPIILAQVGVVSMGITDNIMVANMLPENPALYLGSSGISNSVSFMIASIGIGGLGIFSPIFSKLDAQNNIHKLKPTMKVCFKTALFFIVFTSLIGYFVYYRFELLGQTPQVNIESRPFFLVMMASNIPMFLFVCVRQLTNGLGFAKIAMQATIIGLFINLIGNYLLIAGHLGFPKMGLVGSAFATLIARIIMLIYMVVFVLRSEIYPKLKLKSADKSDLSFRKAIPMSISTGLQFMFEIAAFSIAVVMMGWLGQNQLAAHQIAINIVSFTYMAASGIGSAAGIRVGHARGIQSATAVRLAAKASFFIVTAFMTVTALLIFVFNKEIISLYMSDANVMAIAAILLIIGAIFQISDGVQVVALGLLTGMQDYKIPTLITFLAYWALALPIGYFLAFKLNMDAAGIWIGLLLGLSISALLLTVRFYKIIKTK